MASGESIDITIVGLGPGPAKLRTVAAQEALDSARHIFVRVHPDLDTGGLLDQRNVEDIGALRKVEHDPRGPWSRSIDTVIDAANNGPVVLAIPGHPRFGEGLVEGVLRAADECGLSTRVVDGISVLDLIGSALDIDPIRARVQLVEARTAVEIAGQSPFDSGLWSVSPLRPVLLTHVYDNRICSALSQVLESFYPAEHEITLIEYAGLPGQIVSRTTIAGLGSLNGGSVLAIWIPAIDPLHAGADPQAMHRIVARLRRPDGCPWDRKQTNQSLAKSLVDEVYEAVDAIERGDAANLAEELGDLYLLILMHAQIAHEAGAFSIEDVYAGITRKIVGRHPHVFGEAVVNTDADLAGIWNEAKAREKADGTKSGGKDVDGEPFSMPALTRASSVLKKHPVAESDDPPELLRVVAGIVARGEDPDAVLRQQLRDHLANRHE